MKNQAKEYESMLALMDAKTEKQIKMMQISHQSEINALK